MSSQPNQSLSDGMAVLLQVCAAGSALGGRELGRRMGLHHAKVNRLLMTLADLGLVYQDHQRRYLPAGGLHVLAALAGHGSGLLRRARPALAGLHAEMPDATLAVGVLWQDQVAYLYHAGPGADATAALRLPDLHQVADSSIGVVLRDCSEYAALVHQGGAGRHRSIAVPIIEHGRAVAGLAATGVSMRRRPTAVAERLRTAAESIAAEE